MKYEHIVWDFNGTIVDDVGIGIDSVNPMLAARGLDIIPSVAFYRELFDFPIIDYYKALGFDFSREPYEVVAHEWVRNYKSLSDNAPCVEGVRELIEYFEKIGAKQLILSASESEMLKEKLFSLGLLDKFSHLLALDNIYAHSKLDIAKAYFAHKDKSKYVIIGDTVHDAQVARELGVDAYLVECGHHPRHKLEETGFPVFDDMHALLEYVKNQA